MFYSYFSGWVGSTTNYQVLQSDLVWTDNWPFRGLSDLQLQNQKVALKKLVVSDVFFLKLPWYPQKTASFETRRIWLLPWWQIALEVEGVEGGSHKHYIVIPIGFPWDPGGIWVLPKIGIYTPTWMVYNGKPMKTPIKMDDLGVPLFSETSNMYLHEWLDFLMKKHV